MVTMEKMMIRNSIMIMIFILMIGCVKHSHEDTELGAMDTFWSILGGDTEKLEELKKK